MSRGGGRKGERLAAVKGRDQGDHYEDSDHESGKGGQVINVEIAIDSEREAIMKGMRMELMRKSQHIRSRGKWGASEMPANACRRQQGSNNRPYRITSLSIDNPVIHGVYLYSKRLSPRDDYTADYCCG